MKDIINNQAAFDATIEATDDWDEKIKYNRSGWDKVIKDLPPAQLGTMAVRGYPIDADYLMAKVAEEYGERARDALYRIIRYMPPAQSERKKGKWVGYDGD